jgi:NADH-quinone oxidoreductase subunit J
VMMLNLGQVTEDQEKAWLVPSIWVGPTILAIPLLAEVLYAINVQQEEMAHTVVGAKEVGAALFGPYVLAVELASMLLLAGLVGAYHLARK